MSTTTKNLEKTEGLSSPKKETLYSKKYCNELISILNLAEKNDKDVVQRYNGEIELLESKIILTSEVYNWNPASEIFDRKVINKKYVKNPESLAE